jgi:hydrophobe/amphiphile efflux-1 (HAE1) family protein
MQTPKGFIPSQDMGYMLINVQLPDSASTERTARVIRQIEKIAASVPGIRHVTGITGQSFALNATGSNFGSLFIGLDDYDQRRDPSRSSPAIVTKLNERFTEISDAMVQVFPPPPVRGVGRAGGFTLMVQDRGAAGLMALQEQTETLVREGNDQPQLMNLFSPFRANVPMLKVEPDPRETMEKGVNLADFAETLRVYQGSLYVNDFNLFGRTFRVQAEADSPYRLRPKDVLSLRVRSSSGETVPLGSFSTLRDIAGPYRVPRYNIYPAAELDGVPAPGYSQGQAIDLMQQLAGEVLPDGFGFEWTQLAFQQIRAGNTSIFAFALGVVFVFLVLAAQYESLTLPLAVILIVPMCLVASITGVILRGMDNNILTQVGFIVLIGLAAKNAILIVEFARQLEDHGRDRWAAAVEAARLRLRPILMTSFAFIFGVTPLAWATGAGSELRQALGTTVFSGMIGVTAFGLIFTPAFYVIARWIAQRASRARPQAGQPAPAE